MPPKSEPPKTGESAKEAGASVAATPATSVTVAVDPEKMLKEVLGAVSSLSG